MQLINKELLDSLSNQAKNNPRLRMNYNFHTSLEDPINRLLNAMETDTYVPPHRYPDKGEVFLVLRGHLLFFTFQDDGTVKDAVEVSPQVGVYGMEIEAGVWHSLIVLEDDTVVYEIKKGPYVPVAPEDLATWAPDGSDKEEVKKYLEELKSIV